MSLTILEILYIVLIIFSSIIGTLFIIVLIRFIKILGPIVEIANFYNKIKNIFISYASIPDTIKESIKEKFNKKKDLKEEKTDLEGYES